MADTGPVVFELCAGVGMFAEAVRGVFPGAYVAAGAEWEAYAAAAQLARMGDACVEPHPVWCGDLSGLDARGFLGVVDILCAGLPCQPYSPAGNRKGNADARSWNGTQGIPGLGEEAGPIPHFLRIVKECRPALVFLENVPDWVRSNKQHFRPVGEALCGMGYELCEPVFVAARDVGASHERERVFILAYAVERAGCAEYKQQLREWADELGGGGGAMADVQGESFGDVYARSRAEGDETAHVERGGEGVADAVGDGGRAGCEKRESSGHGELEGAGEDLGDSEGGGCGELRESSGGAGQFDGDGEGNAGPGGQPLGVGLANSECAGCEGAERGGASGAEQREFALGSTAELYRTRLFAPGPGARREWSGIVTDFPNLAPAVEPGFRVLVDGVAVVVDAGRTDQLRCSGNGVVPLAAAVAFAELLREAKLI